MTLEQIARALFDAVRPSRVTIRGAAPGESDSTFLHAEIRADGVPAISAGPQGGIRAAPTYLWLQEHRMILVQNDCRDDPRPPQMLTDVLKVTAQMLGPLFRDGELVGTISVHQQGGPRVWNAADIRSLADAVEQLAGLWKLDRQK